MKDYLVKRPMLLSALVSSAISVVAFYFETTVFIIPIIILALIFFLIYKEKSQIIIFAFLMVFAVSLSTFFTISGINRLDKLSDTYISGEFLVVDGPQNRGKYYSATVEAIKSDNLKKGDRLYITFTEGNVKLSQKFKAQVLVSSNKDSKYKAYNYSEKIYLNGYAKNIKPLDEYDFVLKTVDSTRKYIKTKILENYSLKEASTMLALLTGDDSYFTNNFDYNVKATGLSHIMVVSGMHLTVIVSLFLLFFEGVIYNRYLKAFIIFITVLLVMAVCGFTMSILRAGITYLLMALALLIKRQSVAENTLGGAVTLILIANPFAVLGLSLQLSVLSTFGILAIALPAIDFLKLGKIKNKLVLSLCGEGAISLSALLITMPLTIYLFGYTSNIALITNLLVSFPTTVALIFCILGLLLIPFSEVLFAISAVIVRYINWVVDYFGNLPFAVSNLPKYTSFIIVLIIVAIFWLLLACKDKKNMLKLKEIENIRKGVK